MPIRVPDLDDRRYADLVQEGLSLIPAYSREWTNHNAADPGITLLELFAYISEVFLYRLNRISAVNRAKFLKLLTGENPGPLNHDTLEHDLRVAVVGLRQRSRAITCEDHVAIAREAALGAPPERQVSRAACFPRRNLEGPAPEQSRDRPGHTTVVFVPGDPWAGSEAIDSIREKLRLYFEPKRLLTARVHIVGPRYLQVDVRIRVTTMPGASTHAIRDAAEQELGAYFHPLSGGSAGSGWPFGQSVYTSDIYRVLTRVAGIASVEAVDLDVSTADRLRRNEFHEVTDVRLLPEELVRIRLAAIDFGPPTPDSGGGRA